MYNMRFDIQQPATAITATEKRAMLGRFITILPAILIISLIIASIIFSGAYPASAYPAVLQGNVTINGTPIPSTKIVFNSLEGEDGEDGEISYLSETVTDENGKYAFNGGSASASGRYLVNVTAQSMAQNLTFHRAVDQSQTSGFMQFDLGATITGSVSHARDADRSLENLRVVLKDMFIVADAKTDENGKFSFEMLDKNREYSIEVWYENISYPQPVYVANATVNVSVEVFDSTTSDRDITITQEHVILSQEPSGTWANEVIVFQNTGNETFFIPEGAQLGVSLPSDIQNIQTNYMSCCVVQEDGVMWIDPMEPLMPGDTVDVQVAYQLVPEDNIFNFNKEAMYDINSFSILSPLASGMSINGGADATAEIINVMNGDYDVVTFRGLERGTTAVPVISGVKMSKSGGSGGDEVDKGLLFVVGIIVVGAVAYPFARNINKKSNKKSGKKGAMPVKHDSESDNKSIKELEAEKHAIFEVIHKIDTDFENNRISEEEHQEYRSIYEERAEDLISYIGAKEDEKKVENTLLHIYSKEEAMESDEDVTNDMEGMDIATDEER